LKPWGNEQRHFVATLKELRHRWSAGSMGMATQLLQSCDLKKLTSMCPGLKQPWAGISERFQRKKFWLTNVQTPGHLTKVRS